MRQNKKQKMEKFYEDMNKEYDELKEKIPELVNAFVQKECNKLKKKYKLRFEKEFFIK